MATSVKTAIDRVSRRVRDPQNSAHPRTLVMALLERSEQLVNAWAALVTQEINFEVLPERQIYGALSVNYPQILRVVGVHDQERELTQIDWMRLHHYDGAWFRRIGPEPQVWAHFGRDALIIHPAVRAPRIVHVMAAITPTLLTTENQDLTIPDPYIPMVLSLVELQLLTKSRELDDKLKIVYDVSLGRVMQYGQERSVGPGKQSLEQPSGPTNE